MSIIRAHEAQNDGFRMYKKMEATGFPSLIRYDFKQDSIRTIFVMSILIKNFVSKLDFIQQYSMVGSYFE